MEIDRWPVFVDIAQPLMMVVANGGALGFKNAVIRVCVLLILILNLYGQDWFSAFRCSGGFGSWPLTRLFGLQDSNEALAYCIQCWKQKVVVRGSILCWRTIHLSFN